LKSHPQQDHQELTALPTSLWVLGIVQRRRLHYHAWNENCMVMHSHPMPITDITIHGLARDNVQ